MISVNVLLFGDYTALAKRCLGSIAESIDPGVVSDIRIGVNCIGEATQRYVLDFAARCPVRCLLYEPEGGQNRLKYPLMRRMLYDAERPITASHVMWFDDDSFLTGWSLAGTTQKWWKLVSLEAERTALLGSVYTMTSPHPPAVAEAIAAQPWYTGLTMTPAYKPRFCTGGWWVARYELLKTWNYPFPELKHNGGDTILGELCRQQGERMQHFSLGVKINADEKGRESKAKRRGMQTARLWTDYVPGKVPDLRHQQFNLVVREWPACSSSKSSGST